MRSGRAVAGRVGFNDDNQERQEYHLQKMDQLHQAQHQAHADDPFGLPPVLSEHMQRVALEKAELIDLEKQEKTRELWRRAKAAMNRWAQLRRMTKYGLNWLNEATKFSKQDKAEVSGARRVGRSGASSPCPAF